MLKSIVKNMEINWIYFGVFLNENSKLKILQLLQDNNITIPDGWKRYIHHMTIAFNNKTKEAESLREFYQPWMGQNINLTVNGIGISKDAIAVRVKWVDPIANKIPHITVAIPPNGKPVNSNYIDNWININPIRINGKLEQFAK